MRITQLGHASLFVETADVRVLMDPVLTDTHQEGVLEVFPARTVHWDKLPAFEILFVSHQHLDHFDVDTLARLPRDVQVIIPEDPLIAQTLDRLGFGSVICVKDFSAFTVGDTSFLVTPSSATHPEHGLVVTDPNGTFWNQVDTVPSSDQVDQVLKQKGPIDLLLATWQPMLELEWQYNRPLGFPWNAYGRLLEITRQIRPRSLAPGANGYRYTGSSSWLNQVVFPQTRERYCADVKAMIPALKDRVMEVDAGDVIELVKGEATLHRRESDFVSSDERDPFALEFNPCTAQRSLRDFHTNGNVDYRAAIEEFIRHLFPDFIRDNPLLFRNHKEWSMVYQLEIAHARESEYWWCDFGAKAIEFKKGRNALANFSCGITASGLIGLLNGTGGWDSIALAGNFYQIHRTYGIWERGLVLPSVSLSNPLHLMFLDEDVTERLLDHQIARVSIQGSGTDQTNSAPIVGKLGGKEVDEVTGLSG